MTRHQSKQVQNAVKKSDPSILVPMARLIRRWPFGARQQCVYFLTAVAAVAKFWETSCEHRRGWRSATRCRSTKGLGAPGDRGPALKSEKPRLWQVSAMWIFFVSPEGELEKVWHTAEPAGWLCSHSNTPPPVFALKHSCRALMTSCTRRNGSIFFSLSLTASERKTLWSCAAWPLRSCVPAAPKQQQNDCKQSLWLTATGKIRTSRARRCSLEMKSEFNTALKFTQDFRLITSFRIANDTRGVQITVTAGKVLKAPPHLGFLFIFILRL